MTAACAAGRCVRPSWDVDGVRVPLCWAHWTAATPEARMGWWREHGHRDGAIGPVEQGEPSPALLGLLASIDGPEDRYRGQRLDEASGDWRRTAGEGGTLRSTFLHQDGAHPHPPRLDAPVPVLDAL